MIGMHEFPCTKIRASKDDHYGCGRIASPRSAHLRILPMSILHVSHQHSLWRMTRPDPAEDYKPRGPFCRSAIPCRPDRRQLLFHLISRPTSIIVTTKLAFDECTPCSVTRMLLAGRVSDAICMEFIFMLHIRRFTKVYLRHNVHRQTETKNERKSRGNERGERTADAHRAWNSHGRIVSAILDSGCALRRATRSGLPAGAGYAHGGEAGGLPR